MVRVGVAAGHVTRAALGDCIGQGFAARLFKGVQNFKHAIAFTGAQVDRQQFGLCQSGQFFQRLDMAPGQIHDVDVIAHAGAVHSVIVAAKNLQLLAAAHGDLRDKGQQVVGNVRGVFANQAACMRTDGVEVAQHSQRPLRVRAVEVSQNLFHHELAATIRIGGRSGVLFIERQILWRAIDRGR